METNRFVFENSTAFYRVWNERFINQGKLKRWKCHHLRSTQIVMLCTFWNSIGNFFRYMFYMLQFIRKFFLSPQGIAMIVAIYLRIPVSVSITNCRREKSTRLHRYKIYTIFLRCLSRKFVGIWNGIYRLKASLMKSMCSEKKNVVNCCFRCILFVWFCFVSGEVFRKEKQL